jgi:ribonuclease P protein component
MHAAPKAASVWLSESAIKTGGDGSVLNKLSSREQFTQALKSPVVARTVHFVLHQDGRQSETDVAPSLGCILPKRWAKRAVTRNLLRRLVLVEATRVLSTAKVGAYVVRLRSPIDPAAFPSAKSQALRLHIRQEIQTLFGQAQARLSRTSSP